MSSQSFTRVEITVRDKCLNGEISRSGLKPFKIPQTAFPSIPGKLAIQFETTDYIFSKNITLDNFLHFIKSLLNEYQEQLKSRNKYT